PGAALLIPASGPSSASRCLILTSVQHSLAARRQRYLGGRQRAAALDANEVVGERIFPDGVAWARALPGFHRPGVGAAGDRQPRQELTHQGACRLGHHDPPWGDESPGSGSTPVYARFAFPFTWALP